MAEWITFETRPETWPEPIRDGFSLAFENPDELVEGFEDTRDLPGGSVRDPFNFDGGPAGPEGGAGSGLNLENVGLTTGVVLLIVAAVLLPSFIQGIATALGESTAS